MNKKRKLFLINSIILIINSIFYRILSIYFNGYITQKIGKELLGEFNLIMSVYIFGITLGTFGINFSIIRLGSEDIAIGNTENLKKITQKGLLISFITGLITSCIFIIFSNYIIYYCLHNVVEKKVIYLICIAIPFISMSSSITGYFVAVRRSYKSTIIQFFEQIIKILITILILNLFISKNPDLACFSLILGDLLSEIFSFFCNYLLLKMDLSHYKTNYEIYYNNTYYTKKILNISFPIAITSLIRSGLSTLKQILIPISLEKINLNYKNSLSLYGEINGMAMPIIMFPNIIFSSVSNLFVPEFASFNTQKRHKSIKKIAILLIVISIILSIIISLFLFIFSKKLSTWIYNDKNVAKYIKILAPLCIFVLLDSVIDNILKGLDAQNSVMIINIFDTFIDVILIYTIVPKYGILGYLCSIYISEIFNVIMSGFKLLKVINKNGRI